MKNNEKEISKIKLNNQTYDIKDAEVRRMMDILLGKIPANKKESTNNDNNSK